MQLQREFPGLLILAYCDDVHIVGPPQQAIQAYRRWAGLYSSELQGELRDDKGCVFSPSVTRDTLHAFGLPTSVPPEPATPTKMPFTSEGLRVLGAPVGSQVFYESFSTDTTKTIIDDFDVLSRMPALQGQHVVATKALCHKIVHLLRNIPGGESRYADIADRYDAAVLQVPTRVAGCLVLPELAKQIAQQPWSLGGMGYRTWRKYADGSYLSAYVHNSTMFPTLFPQLAHMFPDVRSLFALVDGEQRVAPSQASYFASRALARLLKKAPGVLEAVAPTSGLSPRKLQHSIALLTDAADDLHIMELIKGVDNISHPRYMAAFLSSKGDPQTMAATPSDNLTTISNLQLRKIAQLKLLLPTTNFEEGPRQCPTCKRTSAESLKATFPLFPTVDVFGDHSTSCQEASGSLRTKLWHDPMVRVWLYLMRGAGIRCDKELQGVVIGSGKRPDIVVPATHGSAEVWYDFRTCTPTSASNCKRAAMEPGYAARRGNELKDDKYAENAHAQDAHFVPLSVEVFGNFGDPARASIVSMSLNAGACPLEHSAFVRMTSQRLYTSNMKAVANLLLANAPFPPGPRFLPPMITVAPVRCPAAAPLALSAASPAAGGRGPFPGGTQQCQPAWLENFLGRTVQDLPFDVATPRATPPSVFAPTQAAEAGEIPFDSLLRAPR